MLVQLLLFTQALAAPDFTPSPKEPPTKVFLVGGFMASPAQMRCWEKGARAAGPEGYEFQGVPYPEGAGSSASAAVSGARAEIQRIVKEIDSNPTRRYVVAGHSSGCAIANRIATTVSHPERIRQVILDGFVSPRIDNVACWGAKGRGGRVSRNYGSMSVCGANRRIYHDTHCDSSSHWCLHFSLVIRSTPANLSDFVEHGYDGCVANLDWLR